MLLTNQRIEEALLALDQFNPTCELRIKLRLNRNLRALRNAHQNKEHDRIRLAYSVAKDKTKKAEPGAQLDLTTEELAELQVCYRDLMATEVEVDLHPVYLWDAEEGRLLPDEQEDFALDVNAIQIDNRTLSALLDVVLFES